MANSVYWIWLQQLFGIGTARSHQMIKDYPDPKELFELATQKELPKDFLAQRETEQLHLALEKAKQLEHRTRSKGCDIITPAHKDYPPLLREIYSPPAVLYVKGEIGCLQRYFPIAIVGTRHCSDYGIEVATSFAQGLVHFGVVVVSGFAHGIDSYAQAAALESGGYSVGVLACGIDVDYPKGNAALKTAASNKGAVVSEFPLGAPPKPYHFAPRNRILAGMSRGVLVIEAGKTSGALITANHGLDMGREVFAVPGSIFTGKHVGSHGLIQRSKAKLVSSPQEMLEEFPEYRNQMTGEFQRQNSVRDPQDSEKDQRPLRIYKGRTFDKRSPATTNSPPKEEKRHKPLPEGLDDTTQSVYQAVNHKRQTADQLAQSTGLSIAEVLSTLTVLEILGLVTSFPGGLFALGDL